MRTALAAIAGAAIVAGGIYLYAWRFFRIKTISQPIDESLRHFHQGLDEFVDYGVAGGGWVPTEYACYKPDCRVGKQ